MIIINLLTKKTLKRPDLKERNCIFCLLIYFFVCLTIQFILFLQCAVFLPEKVPFDQLGTFGAFSKHLADNYPGAMYKG